VYAENGFKVMELFVGLDLVWVISTDQGGNP